MAAVNRVTLEHALARIVDCNAMRQAVQIAIQHSKVGGILDEQDIADVFEDVRSIPVVKAAKLAWGRFFNRHCKVRQSTNPDSVHPEACRVCDVDHAVVELGDVDGKIRKACVDMMCHRNVRTSA